MLQYLNQKRSFGATSAMWHLCRKQVNVARLSQQQVRKCTASSLFKTVLKQIPEGFPHAYGLIEDHEQSSKLEALKGADTEDVTPANGESQIHAMTLEKHVFDSHSIVESPLPGTLYI